MTIRIAGTAGAFYRTRTGWAPVTWSSTPDFLDALDDTTDLRAPSIPPRLPPPALSAAARSLAIAWALAHLLRVGDWSAHCVHIARGCGISYGQATTIARAIGLRPAPEPSAMIHIPDTAWLAEQRTIIRAALERGDIATASRVSDAVLAYVGRGAS